VETTTTRSSADEYSASFSWNETPRFGAPPLGSAPLPTEPADLLPADVLPADVLSADVLTAYLLPTVAIEPSVKDEPPHAAPHWHSSRPSPTASQI
jgi:hypothetical protein